jgi:hypothetical protein
MLVRFLKNHTPYLAGETAAFPTAQAAAFIAARVAVAANSALLDSAEDGPSTLTEQLDSLLAGFRQRGIDVDPTTPIGDLVFHAESILAAERGAADAVKADAEAMTGPVPGREDAASDIAPAGDKPAAEAKPEPEASEGQRRTVTPPRVAKSAQ